MAGWFSMEGATMKSSLQKSLAQMDRLGRAAAAATTIALVEYAEKLLNEMKAQAPHKTYHLIRSGHIEGPTQQGEWTVVSIQWDAPYANIQDKGGTIFPKIVNAAHSQKAFSRRFKGPVRDHLGKFTSMHKVRRARLFIPLRPGVKAIKDPAQRAAAGYKYGIDYVLARAVTLDGSKYITNVLNKHKGTAGRDVGKRAEKIWFSLTEKR